MRIVVTHIDRKTKSGKPRPRPKTIVGLAAKQDGRDLPNPPKVATYGAGPGHVQFFLASATSGGGKGKKGMKASPKAGPSPAGSYVTVEQFFKQGTSSLCCA